MAQFRGISRTPKSRSSQAKPASPDVLYYKRGSKKKNLWLRKNVRGQTNTPPTTNTNPHMIVALIYAVLVTKKEQQDCLVEDTFTR